MLDRLGLATNVDQGHIERDGQHVADLVPVAEGPQVGVTPVGGISAQVAKRGGGGQLLGQHGDDQGRLGREGDLVGHAGLSPASRIGRPGLR